MHLLDVGTSIAKGEIATSSSQTRAISDPYSLKNNFLPHFALHTSQLRLSVPLSLWILRNFTMTFIYPYPLILFPIHTYQLLVIPNGLLTKVVYSARMIGFMYRTLRTSDSKSYRTSMITSSQDISDKTKPLKQFIVTMY